MARGIKIGLFMVLITLGALAGQAAPPVSAATTRYVAMTGTDTGACTNQSSPCETIGFALSVSADGDTINLSAGTYNERGLTISKSVTITGAGPGATLLNGDLLGTVFVVNRGVQASLNGLEIQNAHGSAGAIWNDGTLTLTNVWLINNKADNLGGGIANNGTLTLTDAVVNYNTAAAGGGGGIADAIGSTATLTNVTLLVNSAGHGGGIFNNGTAALTNVRLEGNSATNGQGGGIDNEEGSMTLAGVSVVANASTAYGGGIENTGSLTLTGVTLDSNSAATDGGGVDNGGGAGNPYPTREATRL